MVKERQIILKQLNIEDKERLCELGNNKKIWSKMRDQFPFPYSVQHAEKFIHYTKNTQDLIFGIWENAELVGVVSLLKKEDVYKNNVELGYWLGEKYWNKKIMSKVIGDIIKIAFEEMKARRVYAEVFSNNPASAWVLEKNGFKREAEIKENVEKDGDILDTYVYSRLNPTRKAV